MHLQERCVINLSHSHWGTFDSLLTTPAVVLSRSLTVGPYTKATSKSCFYHIRSFRQNPFIYGSHYGHLCCILLWSLRDLIMLIPSCLVVHRSTRLVFNAYSRHSLEL